MKLAKELMEKRRYTIEDFEALPEDAHIELIDRELYQLYGMTGPLHIHQRLVMELSGTIWAYIRKKGGSCEVNTPPFDVQLFEDEDTIVEPDITVICDKDKITDKRCIGAPDWIIEVTSPGDPGHDFVKKLVLYNRAGVREYWIVNPKDRRVTVYGGEEPSIPRMFTFEDVIDVGIYDDLSIDFKEIMKWAEA